MSDKTIPTWGYKDGEAKIFNLKEGEKLPTGWSDNPSNPAPVKKMGRPKKSK